MSNILQGKTNKHTNSVGNTLKIDDYSYWPEKRSASSYSRLSAPHTSAGSLRILHLSSVRPCTVSRAGKVGPLSTSSQCSFGSHLEYRPKGLPLSQEKRNKACHSDYWQRKESTMYNCFSPCKNVGVRFNLVSYLAIFFIPLRFKIQVFIVIVQNSEAGKHLSELCSAASPIIFLSIRLLALSAGAITAINSQTEVWRRDNQELGHHLHVTGIKIGTKKGQNPLQTQR